MCMYSVALASTVLAEAFPEKYVLEKERCSRQRNHRRRYADGGCAAHRHIARLHYMRSFSMASFSCWIWFLSCEPSFVVMDAAITGRETPHERPRACL